MPSIQDDELGEIIVRRSRRASSIRIKYAANGKYTASIPIMTPLFYLKKVIRESRNDLKTLAAQSSSDAYVDGQQIGQSYTLAVVRSGLTDVASIKTTRNTLVLTVPHGDDISSKAIQDIIKAEVVRVLRKEAKQYLPEKLAYWAQKGQFTYEKIRFSHASGRWGSCSSNGTISLNIALMKLEPQLIEYVLIHELAHTVEMNHSAAFWEIVARYDPLYKLHRRQMKQHTPHL